MRYPYRLPKEDLTISAEYIYAFGRDIDISLYEYYFKKASVSKVIGTLNNYVNQDGGFGRGLALDYIYQGSTPLSTTIGLNILSKLHIFSNNHLTLNALEYLISAINYKNAWNCITRNANAKPHAAWLDYSDDMKELYTLCPTAEIIGYFYIFGGGVYRNAVHSMLDDCYAYLRKIDYCNSANEIICLAKMMRMLPINISKRFIHFLHPRLNSLLCFDLSKYHKNVFTPLDAFESPNDQLFETYYDQIQDNLDYLIDSRNSDGSWDIRYKWKRDEHIFDKQYAAISANITLKNLLSLKKFNRIYL